MSIGGWWHGKRSPRYVKNTDLKKLCFRGIHIHFVSPGDLKSKVLLEICRSIPYGSTCLLPDLFLIWPLFFRSRIYCPPHVFKRLVFSLSWMKMQSSFRFCLVDACMEIPTQVLGHLVFFYATTNKDIPESNSPIKKHSKVELIVFFRSCVQCSFNGVWWGYFVCL